MRCPGCNTENPEGAKFCIQCASPLKRACQKCGSENPPEAKFCAQCAASLTGNDGAHTVKTVKAATGIRLTAESEPLVTDGERKTVTALFADIKDSTKLIWDIDPEDARAFVDPALKRMIEAVHRYDGYVVQSTGDGVFALFGAPVAYEDHPQRAVYAALRVQEMLREYAERLAAQGKTSLQARVGVNTGEVVMRAVDTGGRVEYTPVGHVTNLAARMQTLAPEGGIVISEDTRRLVEGYFKVRALGPTEVKGAAELLSIYEVTGVGPLRTHFEAAARRGLTKFVGRERELAEMRRALELVIGRRGQVVGVVAEAGTGKSRLFYEFKATLPSECKLLESYTVSHGKASAWLPVLELLYGYFGIEDADDKAARRSKIDTRLGALDPALNDTLPLLYILMGLHEEPDPLAQMDPQIKRQRTLGAIKRIILRESLNQPTVVLFEDLHWIDGETQALLDLLADGVANARVLMLVNYRPEYRHEWGNKSYYSQLRLDALGQESAAEMLSTLLGDGVELNPLKRLIVERTEGNPFFIEEMVQALFDEGAIVRNGAVKVARSLSQLRLPPTVQGILASRIDRLPREHKELIQTLAVMGRESPLALIRQVASQADGELEPLLSALQGGEFIYEQTAATGVEYTFKHALTQEVAYNSLLIERRKLLHERVAVSMESLYAERLDDHLGDLAHHYRRSDNVSKAVEYLGRAGQQARRRSAYADATSSIMTAIDLLQRLPDGSERIQRELLLQLAFGSVLIAVKGWGAPEVERAYTRARELCERVGDPAELFPAIFGLFYVYLLRGKLRTAYELAEQLRRRAQTAHDPALLMHHAHQALGQAAWHMGEFVLSRKHLDMAISLYERERQRPPAFRFMGVGFDSEVSCLMYAASNLWTLGYSDQALKKGNEALALAQRLSQPQSLALAEFFIGILSQFRREARAAQETAECLIALSAEHGLTLMLALATSLRGCAMAEQGRNEEGIPQIQEGLAATRETGAELARPYFLTLLAEACGETDRIDDGLSALTEALVAADEHENRSYQAETHRLKGELLLKQDYSNTAEAQNSFQRAVEIARKQSAKSLELRATMSLARLLASQGHRDEARTMLAEIYGWFTEGFDTADLKEAKALLAKLSS